MFRIDTSINPSKKSIYFWNSFGSICNAASSIIFLIVVTRILGSTEGGIFSIGFAIAQLMWSVANFEIITYQVTDVNDDVDFGVYHAAKLILLGISIFCGAGMALYRGYSLYKFSVVVLLCVMRCLDAYSAIYFALFQKKERLDIAGKSTSYRTILTVVIFTLCLITFKDLLITIIISIIFTVLWILFFDLKFVKKFQIINFSFNFLKIKKLLIECFPLFLGSFILISIGNQPKYAIDSLYPETIQNYFAILIMPAAIINLLSLFMFRPMITSLSLMWNNNEYQKFSLYIIKLISYIAIITLGCVGGAFLIGIPILSIVFNVSLTSYKLPLCIILLGGGISAVISLLYNVMAIMRKQRVMLLAYIISFMTAIIISKPLVKNFEIKGASFAYLISMFVMMMMFLLIFAKIYYSTKKSMKGNS